MSGNVSMVNGHIDRDMKEMVYQAERKLEILFEGEYLDHKFVILNLGTHPTAYVECKIPNCNGYDDKRLYDIQVHCGFTYFGDLSHLNKPYKLMYLGWDYAHCGDYAGYYMKYPEMCVLGEKQWTTIEIYEEVKSVIEQLIKVESEVTE